MEEEEEEAFLLDLPFLTLLLLFLGSQSLSTLLFFVVLGFIIAERFEAVSFCNKTCSFFAEFFWCLVVVGIYKLFFLLTL